PVTFQSVAIEKRRILGKVTATGTLQARVTVLVGSQVSGRIQKLYVDYNSTVKKGDLVAKIDPTIFEANVAQAQANHQAARADLERSKAQALLAEKQLARLRSLSQDQLATQADIDTAETNLTVAQAQIHSAEASVQQTAAALRQSQTNLSFTTIRSPIDGTVISRSVDVGQTVAASLQAPTLFTIAEDLRKMQVITNVSEGDVGRLTTGTKASFTVDAFAGQRFFGSIVQIRNAAQTVQNVVTYNAIIEFDNPELKLRPDMTANASIVFAERADALAVPNAALRFNPPPEANLKLPEKVGKDPTGRAAPLGTGQHGQRGSGSPGAMGGGAPSDTKTLWVPKWTSAEAVSVKVGLSDGTYTELVESPIKEGDKVVIDATVSGKSSNAASTGTSGAASPPGGMRRMF
ncbi:MAG TPA: efflux RND transporter periplasmic adaptor subunit, partial [Polyangiaceae bacterium]